MLTWYLFCFFAYKSNNYPCKNMNDLILLVTELKILYLECFKVKLKAKKAFI